LDKVWKLGLVGLCILTVAAGNASEAFAQFQFERFALYGNGSFMDSPPIFSGYLIAGDVSPGQFWIYINDTGWDEDDPLTTEVNERWEYILANYFTYSNTTGNEGWDGQFAPTGLGIPHPTWRFWTDAGDTLGGILSALTVTIRDYDADQVVDEVEYANKVLGMNLVCYISYSGGCYYELCGQGSASGQLDVLDAEIWEEEIKIGSVTTASGLLILQSSGCTTATESKSWSGIKAIYKD
jgi:hypothetical protein